MKGRWGSVFTKALEVSCAGTGCRCCMCSLHNVCMRMGDAPPEELEEDVHIGGDHDTEPPSQDPEAAQIRDRLAARLSCPAPRGDHDYHADI
ncbi:hypothetical protein HPB52_018301 [Rhipicephalus sanguineus]|uniref:Uncharacterized protein n=1 Tax=Rhipicephalus sanguineus TaxID=34632 RepID=A0A9D4PDC8_RHISA|nr:hypothetical protein HPB52_018301 [Rhipicephalus sanguineus]